MFESFLKNIKKLIINNYHYLLFQNNLKISYLTQKIKKNYKKKNEGLFIIFLLLIQRLSLLVLL